MSTLPTDAGATLLSLARDAIAARLGAPTGALPAHAAWLDAPGASFVTLTQQGRLRGCIGSLEAHRPLGDDVRANAVNAAVRDPRFSPLTAAELARTHVEVSVLSAPEPVAFAGREEALAVLRPGVDGVILTRGAHRGTFLPQVWEQLPTPEDFLSHLVRKAGLPAGFWDEAISLQRYTVTAFEEGRDD